MNKSPRKVAIRPFITGDEIGFVKAHLLMGILLSVFQRDKTVIKKSEIKTPAPYITLIDRAMDDVTGEIKLIRQYFRRAGIKILVEKRDNEHRSYGCKYVCRGYTGSFSMLDSYLAADISVLKRKFLGEDVSRFDKAEVPAK